MGAFKHLVNKRLSRRDFVRGSAMAGGALALGGMGTGLGAGSLKADKRFNDIEVAGLWDNNWQNAPMWLSPLLQAEAGVSLKSRELYDAGETTAKIVPQLLSNNPRFDWFCMPSLYFGLFAEVGLLEPLDQYLDNFGGSAEYFDWIMPGYGEFYSQWGGQTYGLMVDGDIHNLHYRPSYFADADNQKEFSKQFQRELTVPTTWEEYRDTARFFTEKYSSQDIYGTSVVMNPPNFSWGFWMDVAGSYGVTYFDRNMNPQINQGRAAESLEMFKEIVETGPPGKTSMSIGETIARWESGADVMSVWWIDLAEFTVRSQGLERASDQATALVPGTQQEDGSMKHTPVALYSRTLAVPANASEEVKEAAAYFIYRMSHPDYSMNIVADPFCGSDPYGKTHFTDEAAQMYTEPNPQRGTDELWPVNDGIFKTFDQARRHLDGCQANVENAFPQIYWEGAGEYGDALGRAISRFISDEVGAQDALDDAAEEWVQITQKLGFDSQKSQHDKFLDATQRAGLNFSV